MWPRRRPRARSGGASWSIVQLCELREDSSLMYLIAAVSISVGVLWWARAERLVDGLRNRAKTLKSHSRARQIVVARAFGVFEILLGIVIAALVVSGTIAN